MDQDLLAVLVVADAQFAGADPQDGGAHGDCAGILFPAEERVPGQGAAGVVLSCRMW